MRKRVTKEIAQQRVDAIGRELTILEWKDTSSLCKVQCNKCGMISEVKVGNYVYREDSRYFRWKDCTGCMIEKVKVNIKKRKADNEIYYQSLVVEGLIIDNGIELVREELKKYLDKEVIALDLINDISSVLRINSMSVVKFNYSVLDRIADYEVTKLNKFGKKGYIIKSIFDVALPKTKKRSELEENKWIDR